MEQLQKAQDVMGEKMSNIERRSKASNLIMHGVPLLIDDQKSKEENMITSVMKIIEEAGIQGVKSSDFVSVSKVVPSGQTHFLLVTFTSTVVRRKLFAQRTKLRQCKERIFFNEDLTKEQAGIHKKARKQVKEGTLHSVWTAEGLVYGKSSPEGVPFQIKNL
jgi:hypothetical protein